MCSISPTARRQGTPPETAARCEHKVSGTRPFGPVRYSWLRPGRRQPRRCLRPATTSPVSGPRPSITDPPGSRTADSERTADGFGDPAGDVQSEPSRTAGDRPAESDRRSGIPGLRPQRPATRHRRPRPLSLTSNPAHSGCAQIRSPAAHRCRRRSLPRMPAPAAVPAGPPPLPAVPGPRRAAARTPPARRPAARRRTARGHGEQDDAEPHGGLSLIPTPRIVCR
jgi:hypothetical protein